MQNVTTKNCLFILVLLSESELSHSALEPSCSPQVTDACVLHANKPVSLGVGSRHGEPPWVGWHDADAERGGGEGNTRLCLKFILIANCWKQRRSLISGTWRERVALRHTGQKKAGGVQPDTFCHQSGMTWVTHVHISVHFAFAHVHIFSPLLYLEDW